MWFLSDAVAWQPGQSGLVEHAACLHALDFVAAGFKTDAQQAVKWGVCSGMGAKSVLLSGAAPGGAGRMAPQGRSRHLNTTVRLCQYRVTTAKGVQCGIGTLKACEIALSWKRNDGQVPRKVRSASIAFWWMMLLCHSRRFPTAGQSCCSEAAQRCLCLRTA